MHQTDIPSLATNDAVAGFVFQQPEAEINKKFDRKSLEAACVDMISQLEYMVFKAQEMSRIDFVDETAEIGRKMLVVMADFAENFLTGNAAEQAKGEIERAVTYSHTYDEVLKTRSMLNTVLRTIWKADENREIQSAHKQLGEIMVRACAATLYHAIMLLGMESEIGKQIDQSTVIFVNELKQAWNNQND